MRIFACQSNWGAAPMKLLLVSCLSAVVVSAGCATAPAQSTAPAVVTSGAAASAGAASDVAAAEAAAFAQCKAEAARRNLALPQHQDALFACARQHAGKRGETCLGQMILSKTRVSDLEQGMAHCLKVTPRS